MAMDVVVNIYQEWIMSVNTNFHPSKSLDVNFGSSSGTTLGSSPGSIPGLINRYPLLEMTAVNNSASCVHRNDKLRYIPKSGIHMLRPEPGTSRRSRRLRGVRR